MKKNQNWTEHGFSIVELLIVIVVLGILAAITIVSYTGISQKAVAASLQSDLSGAVKQLKLYQLEHEAYPTLIEDCPTPASGNMCLQSSSGNDYDYQVNNSSSTKSFYLHATNGLVNYRVTADSNPSQVTLVCPLNFIVVPGNSTYGTDDFCVMKYEAKIQGNDDGYQVYNSAFVPESRTTGTPWTRINQVDAITESQTVCEGCHLISESEWMTIAQNVLNVDSNWSGGTVGSGYIYSGHNDRLPNGVQPASSNDDDGYFNTSNYAGDTTVSLNMVGNSQRRTLTLSNGEVIWDLSGNIREWTSGQTTGGQPGVLGAGFAYREWNAVTTAGTLTFNPYPANGTPAASTWNYAQGMGRVYSSTEDSSLRGFIRGGNWDNNTHSGIFTLVLNTAPTYASWQSFRVAK